MRQLIAIALLAGCGMSADGPSDTCATTLTVTPTQPLAGQQVRVTAETSAGQINVYEWSVQRAGLDVLFQVASAAGDEITFDADLAGDYDVSVVPSGCSQAMRTIDVNDAGVDTLDIRLHVTPPAASNIPPIDRPLIVPGGSNHPLNRVLLDLGREASGSIGMAGYLRFMPDGQPEAIVETYAAASGAFTTRTQSAPHHILIIPNDPAYPPQIKTGTPGANVTYTLTTGTAISGVVRRPNGSALAGARVQLFSDEDDDATTVADTVPSTTGMTLADGTFTLRASTVTGSLRVVVTPPEGSGLPRLEARSSAFSTGNGLTIAYASGLTTRNAGGTVVTRGTPLADAKVSVVGTIPQGSAGTISAGVTVDALGSVRIAANTNASGVLPSMIIPAASLYAVVEAAPGDAAVVEFGPSSTTIATPAMTSFTTTAQFTGSAVAGARLVLEPEGPLALAGVAATVSYGDANGVITGALASGAQYTLRVGDPAGNAGTFTATEIADIPTTTQLPRALKITGRLEIQMVENPIPNAAIEIFCNDMACTGLARTRAIGEGTSDAQGTFSVAVTDPVPM